jgi:hypothetical protein
MDEIGGGVHFARVGEVKHSQNYKILLEKREGKTLPF